MGTGITSVLEENAMPMVLHEELGNLKVVEDSKALFEV